MATAPSLRSHLQSILYLLLSLFTLHSSPTYALPLGLPELAGLAHRLAARSTQQLAAAQGNDAKSVLARLAAGDGGILLHGTPSSSVTGGYITLAVCGYLLVLVLVARWCILRAEARRERRAASEAAAAAPQHQRADQDELERRASSARYASHHRLH